MESFGVAKADITKLKAGGYHTIEAVFELTFCQLSFLYFMIRLHILPYENLLKSRESVNNELKS